MPPAEICFDVRIVHVLKGLETKRSSIIPTHLQPIGLFDQLLAQYDNKVNGASSNSLGVIRPASAILNQPSPGPADGFWAASGTFFIQAMTGPSRTVSAKQAS
jgi:hypothetical protein